MLLSFLKPYSSSSFEIWLPLQLSFDGNGSNYQQCVLIFPLNVKYRKHRIADDLAALIGHDKLQFREIVRHGGVFAKKYSVTGNKIVTSGELAQIKVQLGKPGLEIDIREM